MTYPGTKPRERTALESSLTQDVLRLERERDELVEACDRALNTLIDCCISDGRDSSRQRIVDAKGALRAALSRVRANGAGS